MKTHLQLELTHSRPVPEAFQHDDVRFPDSLVEHFLQQFTQPGNHVLDPFAGYGTTMIVAERMGRVPFGIELTEAKVDYVRSQLQWPGNLIHGDARQLGSYDLPPIDFVITSPPYMHKDDPEDPFTDYQEQNRGYRAYLHDIRIVFGQLRRVMRPAGTVVIEVSNLKQGGRVTTLAWDIADQVSQVLHFDGEVVVCWDQYGFGYDHSYCLVYTNL